MSKKEGWGIFDASFANQAFQTMLHMENTGTTAVAQIDGGRAALTSNITIRGSQIGDVREQIGLCRLTQGKRFAFEMGTKPFLGILKLS